MILSLLWLTCVETHNNDSSKYKPWHLWIVYSHSIPCHVADWDTGGKQKKIPKLPWVKAWSVLSSQQSCTGCLWHSMSAGSWSARKEVTRDVLEQRVQLAVPVVGCLHHEIPITSHTGHAPLPGLMQHPGMVMSIKVRPILHFMWERSSSTSHTAYKPFLEFWCTRYCSEDLQGRNVSARKVQA